MQSGAPYGFFLLDTRSNTKSEFVARAPFEAALAAQGLEASNIRWPGLFFNSGRWWRWVFGGLAMTVIVVGGIAVRGRRRSRSIGSVV